MEIAYIAGEYALRAASFVIRCRDVQMALVALASCVIACCVIAFISSVNLLWGNDAS